MLAPFGIRPKGTLLARMLPLAQALAQRGHTLSIVAPPVHNPQDAASRVVYGAVPVVHTPLPRTAGPAAILEQSYTLLQAARAEAPDLLHLFKPKGYGGLAALAAKPLGLPLVLDTDDWEGPGGWNELLPYPVAARQLFAWQERDLPRRAAAVTVASRTLESLVWAMGVPPQRVFYLPNGVYGQVENMRVVAKEREVTQKITSSSPLSHVVGEGAGGEGHLGRYSSLFAQSSDNPPPPTLLLYTRFWELDLAELAAALVAIHLARPEVRLIVVGRGEQGEEEQLLALAARAGFAPMLNYRGWLQPEAIPAVLAQAQIALVPTRDTLINRARCSAKMLELMDAGLAIVATDVGEARSFINHEQSGLLVPPANPAALAAATLRLIADAPLRQRLAAGARAATVAFHWAALAQVAEAAYDCCRADDHHRR
ncbi:MAG: glycosyltransferase [Candidatus Viridilinea halotolerans]|uniref:Glycosyltransferase n=1 Tax=Candidatus Viridilinea halotolerans TaxID=2491704 RepID=A0A426U671_9CHLR|nr:MAG: glycosyltransferase [Candidatus Viridilinea halotolerans]